MSNENVVGISADGYYAVVGFHRTHTGTRSRVDWTSDINRATVLTRQHCVELKKEGMTRDVIHWLPAVEERTVKLIAEQESKHD